MAIQQFRVNRVCSEMKSDYDFVQRFLKMSLILKSSIIVTLNQYYITIKFEIRDHGITVSYYELSTVFM